MPIFDTDILEKLGPGPLAKLSRGAELVMPRYDGYNLANISPTIAKWLGVNGLLPAQRLASEITDHFKDQYQNVVLILVDALGYKQLIKMMNEGNAPLWKDHLDEGKLFPLTSISPSTTASALTTIWTGSTPNYHGVIGYEMWYKQLSLIMNNITHNPITYAGDVGGLAKAGFEPTKFMTATQLGHRFAHSRVESHSFMPGNISNSGLSKMHLPGSTAHPYVAESDMLLNMRDLLNSASKRRRFVYAYWSDVDSLMHQYGTHDPRVTEQFRDFSNAFFRLFVDGLDASTRENTLILLTADHGSLETPVNETYNLNNHPELTDMLTMAPTCEGRLPFLYVKQGQIEAVKAYFDHAWPNQFDFLSRQEVLDMQLLGNCEDNPDLENRIGDLVAIPFDNTYLWWPKKANTMLGRHGGLHPDEMLTPLFAL